MATGETRKKNSLSSPAASSRTPKGQDDSRAEPVVVLVDGRRFTVSKSLFSKYPNTMLGRLALDYI